MDSLPDPGSLRGRSDTPFREEQSVAERNDFEYFDSIGGMVAVGVLGEGDEVLLMNGPHGWRLPYGTVEAGADWVTVGERYATAMTGVDIEVRSVERVTEVTRRLEGGRDETTNHDVVLRTAPVRGHPIAATPAFGPWDDVEVEWFSGVPGDAYWDHGDAVDDIRRCLERDVE
jgi:hypothetical protein